MRLVIVTGMSGAGKRTAIKFLEDLGYFCVDNLPVSLIRNFINMIYSDENNSEINKMALGIDIRSGHVLDEVSMVVDEMKQQKKDIELLFLDAPDDILIKRFKETRRKHPIADYDTIEENITYERTSLSGLRSRSDYIIDTGSMLTKELNAQLKSIFVDDKAYKNMYINIVSFGFKYGIPIDADLVFDVRFMPNPFYVPDLKHKTGNDKEVRDFVMAADVSKEFLDKLTDMIKFLAPNYVKEGKNQLVVAIGCTGGKHRSVTIANLLYEALKDDDSYGIKLTHRNVGDE